MTSSNCHISNTFRFVVLKHFNCGTKSQQASNKKIIKIKTKKERKLSQMIYVKI